MRLPSVLAVYNCTVICDQNARLTLQVYEKLLSKKWLTDAASLSPNPWGPIKYQGFLAGTVAAGIDWLPKGATPIDKSSIRCIVGYSCQRLASRSHSCRPATYMNVSMSRVGNCWDNAAWRVSGPLWNVNADVLFASHNKPRLNSLVTSWAFTTIIGGIQL